jgi:hypothetical protein
MPFSFLAPKARGKARGTVLEADRGEGREGSTRRIEGSQARDQVEQQVLLDILLLMTGTPERAAQAAGLGFCDGTNEVEIGE